MKPAGILSRLLMTLRKRGTALAPLPLETPARAGGTVDSLHPEQVLRIVVTGKDALDARCASCAQCATLLSRYYAPSDTHEPTVDMLHAAGCVPIPNLGWFCSQECAHLYEQASRLSFQRQPDGRIDYHAGA